MSYSTLPSSGAPAVDLTATQPGNGLTDPVPLTQASLEEMLHEVVGFADRTGQQVSTVPTTRYIYATYPRRRGCRSQILLRQRHYRGFSSVAYVARELVEDGFVPARCIRGWNWVAEYALTDRRRARRIARRVRDYSPQRSARNATIRDHCKRR